MQDRRPTGMLKKKGFRMNFEKSRTGFQASDGLLQLQHGRWTLEDRERSLEPGYEFDFRLRTVCRGVSNEYNLGCTEIWNRPHCVAAIRIDHQSLFAAFLRLKDFLGNMDDERTYMEDLAGGIATFFARSSCYSPESSYIVTIPADLITLDLWKGLARAPDPLGNHLILGSALVGVRRPEKIDREAAT